jgi:hypothetical protein
MGWGERQYISDNLSPSLGCRRIGEDAICTHSFCPGTRTLTQEKREAISTTTWSDSGALAGTPASKSRTFKQEASLFSQY